MRLVSKALLAAAAVAGIGGLAAAPASARTVVTFGIGAPVYPAYYGGYYAPRPYYPAYYGGYYAPAYPAYYPAYGYGWHRGWRHEWRHEGWHDRGWHHGWRR